MTVGSFVALGAADGAVPEPATVSVATESAVSVPPAVVAVTLATSAWPTSAATGV